MLRVKTREAPPAKGAHDGRQKWQQPEENDMRFYKLTTCGDARPGRQMTDSARARDAVRAMLMRETGACERSWLRARKD